MCSALMINEKEGYNLKVCSIAPCNSDKKMISMPIYVESIDVLTANAKFWKWIDLLINNMQLLHFEHEYRNVVIYLKCTLNSSMKTLSENDIHGSIL